MSSFEFCRHLEQNWRTKWFLHYRDSLWLRFRLQSTMKICQVLCKWWIEMENKRCHLYNSIHKRNVITIEWMGMPINGTALHIYIYILYTCNETYSFSSGLAGESVLSFSCSLRKIVTRATVCLVFSDSKEIFHWSVVAVAPKIFTPDLARALETIRK